MIVPFRKEETATFLNERFDHIIKPNYAKHILAAEYKIKYKYNHKYLGY